MKKMMLLVLIGSLAVSCKKNGSPGAKEQLLSKVYENDELLYAFEYRADRKLHRLKKYPSGSLTPNIIYEYEYDAKGRLQQKTYINGLTGIPGVRFLYESNDAGQIVKRLAYDISGADSGKLSLWAAYSYNAQKRMVKENNYFGDDKPAGYRTWEYADNGTVLSIKAYGEKPSGSMLVELWECYGGAPQVDPGIIKAWVEPGETELLFFDADKIDITHYSDGSAHAKYRYLLSDRKTVGTAMQLSEQLITYVKVFPAAPSLVELRQMRYEYVEQ